MDDAQGDADAAQWELFYRVVTINLYAWMETFIVGCLRPCKIILRSLFCFLPVNSIGDKPGRGIIQIILIYLYERRKE